MEEECRQSPSFIVTLDGVDPRFVAKAMDEKQRMSQTLAVHGRVIGSPLQPKPKVFV